MCISNNRAWNELVVCYERASDNTDDDVDDDDEVHIDNKMNKNIKMKQNTINNQLNDDEPTGCSTERANRRVIKMQFLISLHLT